MAHAILKSEDQEFVTPIAVAAVLLVVHFVTFFALSSSSAKNEPIPGGKTSCKRPKSRSDPIYAVLSQEAVSSGLSLAPGYKVLSYSMQVVNGLKYAVQILPKEKRSSEESAAGRNVIECDVIVPPLQSSGPQKPPFVLNVRRRVLTASEECALSAHVLAHQAASFISVVVLGGLGAWEWFGGMGPLHAAVRGLSALPYADGGYAQRYFLSHPRGFFIGQINLGFQLYDLVATVAIKDLFSTVMVAHHIGAACIALAVMYPHLLGGHHVPPTGQYDLVFFYGLTEVSTIPLAIHDALKLLPQLLATSPALKTLDEISKPLFAVLFLAVRCVYFPVVMWGFWRTLLVQLLSHGPLTPKPVLALVFVGSVGMGALQLFWGYKIACILAAIAFPNADKKKTI